MKSDSSSIVKNIIWALIALGINYLIGFLITPYVTNNIGIEAYGFVGLANTFTTYVDILSVGLNSFAGRFISVAYFRKDYETARKYYTATVVGNLLLSALVCIPSVAGIVFLEKFIKIPDGLVFDVKLLFFFIMLNYFLTTIRTADNTATFISNRLDISEQKQGIAYLIKSAFLLIPCMLLTPHVWYVGFASAVASFYFLVAAMRLRKKYVPQLYVKRKYWDPNAIFELTKNGVWNSVNEFGNALNTGLDLLITELMINPTVLGQISVAKSLSVPGYAIVKKIGASYQPKQLQYYAQHRNEEQIRLFKRAMILTGSFFIILTSTFYACGTEFLSLWIPNQNIPYIFSLVMIVLIGEIVPSIVSPLFYIFTMTKKIKLPCIITLCMGITNVASMYLLVKYTPLDGYAVVLTTAVISAIHLFDTPIYSAHCLKVNYLTFYPEIIRCVASFAVAMGVAFFIKTFVPPAHSWSELAVKVGITGAVLLLLVSVIAGSFNIIKEVAGDKF